MTTDNPVFEPKIVFQIIHQLLRLASDRTLKKDDLQFFLKQYQNELMPHNDFLPVLCVTNHPVLKEMIPLVCLYIDSMPIEENILTLDIYIMPGQLNYSQVEEEFGAAHLGLHFFEKELSLVSDVNVAVWQMKIPYPILLMVLKNSDTTSCTVLRLVFQGFNNTPIHKSYWKTIRSNGKSLADSFTMKIMIEMAGFVTLDTQKSNVLNLATEKKRIVAEKEKKHQASIKFTDTLFEHYIHCQATHLHLYSDNKNTSYAMFRQGRSPCLRYPIPSNLVSKVIHRIKHLFKMNCSVMNQSIMDGRYIFNTETSEAIELKAQVTHDKRGEYLIIYRQLETYPVQVLTLDWKNRNQLLVRHLEDLPLYIPLNHLSLSQYQQLPQWLDELIQMGFNVLLNSRARLSDFQSGYACFFNHGMNAYIDKHRLNVLESIRDVFHFDIHIDILSLDDPINLIPRKHWEEYFCAQCCQFFVSYRQSNKEVVCPSCKKKGFPPVHNMNTFSFASYIKGYNGKKCLQKAKSDWILDDGCEYRYYNKSPLRDGAIQLTAEDKNE